MSQQNPRKIAILTQVFRLGYGVGVVIATQAQHLRALGYEVHIFALHTDGARDWEGIPVWQLWRTPTALRAILRAGGFNVVIAHTPPFFRLLPQFHDFAHTIAYEHGSPPPEFFVDAQLRAQELANMDSDVYARVDRVVAISEFMRRYINWPDSVVIYNGADHLRARTAQVQATPNLPEQPLRILCVARFGEHEFLYKGMDLLQQLRGDLPAESFEIRVVGRGGPEQVKTLQQSGMVVLPNVPDDVLAQEYRDCHALVSFSRWEGFNLPLVEAGIWAKAALALDIGAHAEVTPLCFAKYEDLRDFLLQSTAQSLAEAGQKTADFVARFTWAQNVEALVDVLNSVERSVAKTGFLGGNLLARGALQLHFGAFELLELARRIRLWWRGRRWWRRN
ncbi:MAG: glycosyltransferase family 4 protein [Fibrobacter sp.]|nr:glycosyltransferase family 4 protein [Fibrobacter sp.]